MNKNLLKLRKMILSLQEIATDKATLICEGEIAAGAEVFVEDENGELIPAADGEYLTESQVITVSEGKVAEIKDKEPEQKQEPEGMADDAAAALAEKDARIAELEGAIAEKDAELEAKGAELAEKDARIAELEAELEDLKGKLAESDARSAEEELKMNKQKPVKSGLKFDLFK